MYAHASTVRTDAVSLPLSSGDLVVATRTSQSRRITFSLHDSADEGMLLVTITKDLMVHTSSFSTVELISPTALISTSLK